MSNLSENHRQNQALKQLYPRPAKPGRIDARPRNVVRDPATGARLGVTRPDGSFIPMSSEMGHPRLPERGRPVPSYMQSRADRVAAAMRDGTFQQKRDAYNRASHNYMNEKGDIEQRPDPTAKIITSADGSKTLKSVYGTGSSGPRASQFTINTPVGQARSLEIEQPKVPVQDPKAPVGLPDFGDAKGLEALFGNTGTIAATPSSMFPGLQVTAPQSPPPAQAPAAAGTAAPPKETQKGKRKGLSNGGLIWT